MPSVFPSVSDRLWLSDWVLVFEVPVVELQPSLVPAVLVCDPPVLLPLLADSEFFHDVEPQFLASEALSFLPLFRLRLSLVPRASLVPWERLFCRLVLPLACTLVRTRAAISEESA